MVSLWRILAKKKYALLHDFVLIQFSVVYLFCTRHIYQDDLMQFMRDDEALKTISHFEGASGWKGITRKELKNWMVII